MTDFISEEEEQNLIRAIDEDPNWKESQSGRRKIDYGPQVNFKKKKVKAGQFKGLPAYAKTFVLDKLPAEIAKTEKFANAMEGFSPIEVNILEYLESKGSNIMPHFDDFWIWGERILGLNLVSDCVMQFQRADGD